jgi:hypothetical protein
MLRIDTSMLFHYGYGLRYCYSGLIKRWLTMDEPTRYALIAEICDRLAEEKQEAEQGEKELNF